MSFSSGRLAIPDQAFLPTDTRSLNIVLFRSLIRIYTYQPVWVFDITQ
tara:strand:+ start:285 stop:428 length:144 start_codon:yes stop_codon:yes gene_type:complete